MIPYWHSFWWSAYVEVYDGTSSVCSIVLVCRNLDFSKAVSLCTKRRLKINEMDRIRKIGIICTCLYLWLLPWPLNYWHHDFWLSSCRHPLFITLCQSCVPACVCSLGLKFGRNKILMFFFITYGWPILKLISKSKHRPLNFHQ